MICNVTVWLRFVQPMVNGWLRIVETYSRHNRKLNIPVFRISFFQAEVWTLLTNWGTKKIPGCSRLSYSYRYWDDEIATFTSETLKGLVKLQLCVARAVWGYWEPWLVVVHSGLAMNLRGSSGLWPIVLNYLRRASLWAGYIRLKVAKTSRALRSWGHVYCKKMYVNCGFSLYTFITFELKYCMFQSSSLYAIMFIYCVLLWQDTFFLLLLLCVCWLLSLRSWLGFCIPKAHKVAACRGASFDVRSGQTWVKVMVTLMVNGIRATFGMLSRWWLGALSKINAAVMHIFMRRAAAMHVYARNQIMINCWMGRPA